MAEPDFIPANAAPDFIPASAPGKFTQLSGFPTLANAPGGPKSQPMSSVRTLTGTPYNPGRIERGLLGPIGAIGQAAANVSAPVIGHRVLQRTGLIGPKSRIYEGEGTLEDTARDATAMIAPEGMEAEAASGVSPRIAAPKAAAPVATGDSGMLGRAGEVALRRAGRIPGVQAVKDADYILRGPKAAPEATAAAAIAKPSPIPETNGIPWGSGGQGPLDLRGKRAWQESNGFKTEPVVDIGAKVRAQAPPLPRISGQAGSMAKSVEAEPIETPDTLGTLHQQINDALGGKPLQKGVSLRNQRPLTNLQDQIRESVGPSAQTPKAPLGNLQKQIADEAHPLPEGFTPVESSVLKGYKYDPETQKFTGITNAGQSYTHAEVTPDEFKTFEATKSKGTAWNKQIRANHVQVEKNGAPTKPIAPHSAGPEDLSPEWQKKAKKKARIAKPSSSSAAD